MTSHSGNAKATDVLQLQLVQVSTEQPFLLRLVLVVVLLLVVVLVLK